MACLTPCLLNPHMCNACLCTVATLLRYPIATLLCYPTAQPCCCPVATLLLPCYYLLLPCCYLLRNPVAAPLLPCCSDRKEALVELGGVARLMEVMERVVTSAEVSELEVRAGKGTRGC